MVNRDKMAAMIRPGTGLVIDLYTIRLGIIPQDTAIEGDFIEGRADLCRGKILAYVKIWYFASTL